MAKKEIAEAKAAETSAKKEKGPSAFIKFDMNRPKSINVTKDRFVTTVLYKELNIMFEAQTKTIDLAGTKDAIIKSVNRIIKLMRCEGVQRYYSTDELKADKPNYIMSILVPYFGRQELVIKNIMNMLKQLSDDGDVSCKGFIKNVALINVDTTKEQKNVFIKGFVSASHETITKKRFIDGNPNPKISKIEKNNIRGQTFLSNSVWNSDEAYKDIGNYNRFSMILNRISIYDPYDGKTFSNSVPFKKSFKTIAYQIVNNDTDNTYKLIRNECTISLCLKDREDSTSEYVKKDAIGVYVENNETSMNIGDFRDIFYQDKKFLLTNNEYLRIDENAVEIDMFKNDINFIDEDIFKSLEKEDVLVEEKPKKKNSKGEKKMEKKTDEEPAFNDVGSLADIEDVNVDIDNQVLASDDQTEQEQPEASE